MLSSVTFVTIGQTPRTDLVPELAFWLPGATTVREVGALDGLDAGEVAAYAPAPGEARLVTRMADGTQAVVSGAWMHERLQSMMDALPRDPTAVTVLLCTGAFPGLHGPGLFLDAQHLVDHGVAALCAGMSRIGLLLPLAEQAADFHWRPAPHQELHVAHASPYGADGSAQAPPLRGRPARGPLRSGRRRALPLRRGRHALHGVHRGTAAAGGPGVGAARAVGPPPRGVRRGAVAVTGGGPPEGGAKTRHPSLFEPVTLLVGAALAVLGAVIGVQLLTRVGITPNSSVIGAILALALARIPLALFRPFGNIHRQNLLQTVVSGATFGGANALLLPVGIPWLMGRPDLIPAMLGGAFLAMIVDATLLYHMFDSRTFPAAGLWPSGVATAEVLIAGDEGGGRARLLAAGGVVGGVGQLFGIPMDVFGVCWIGNVWALSMFAVGLLVRGYAPSVLGVDLNDAYVPHGIMIGAGLVALGQIVAAARDRRGGGEPPADESGASPAVGFTVSGRVFGRALGGGFVAYLGVAAILAGATGAWADMSPAMLVGFVVFAAVAALISELVVGLSAMHAGWFPAFATALIFLVVGMLLGFPQLPLAVLVGFTAATGPAFADMGYDLKAGWILRGRGADPALEREGRRQQFMAEFLGFAVAGLFVLTVYPRYFAAGLIPPVDRVFAATIAAGTSPELARSLLLWAIPGALVQWVGGSSRQLGVLLATGLLIVNPVAGWTAAAALVVRGLLSRRYGAAAETPMYVAAGGFIAGSALVGFGVGAWRAR